MLTVVLVPLSFLRGADILESPVVFLLDVPKVAVLRTLVGLMAGLWLIEWGIRQGLSLNDLFMASRKAQIDPGKWLRAVVGWVSNQRISSINRGKGAKQLAKTRPGSVPWPALQ